MNSKGIIYIHGKGGSGNEAEHYRSLFSDWDITGIEYKTDKPWEAAEELKALTHDFFHDHDRVILIANSIGAYFSMLGLADQKIEKAYFISPIVNMKQLILDMMSWVSVTEDELRIRETVDTSFGEQLSWKYLCWVREHPVSWRIPTCILYGGKDNLQSIKTVRGFAEEKDFDVTVMPEGEHWFHTPEQMAFLDNWISKEKDIIWAKGKEYRIIKLLGHGKGGYSYKVTDGEKEYVLKQIHHEPCDYYQFGNKLEAELNDYRRLKKAGIRIPEMICYDEKKEIIVKQYIAGETVMEMAQNGQTVDQFIPQAWEMALLAEKAGLNIDYYPTNFVVHDDRLWYIDYECNEYCDKWNFENWGIKYWSCSQSETNNRV